MLHRSFRVNLTGVSTELFSEVEFYRLINPDTYYSLVCFGYLQSRTGTSQNVEVSGTPRPASGIWYISLG